MAARQASSEPPATQEKVTPLAPATLAPATAAVQLATSAASASCGMHHRTWVPPCGWGRYRERGEWAEWAFIQGGAKVAPPCRRNGRSWRMPATSSGGGGSDGREEPAAVR